MDVLIMALFPFFQYRIFASIFLAPTANAFPKIRHDDPPFQSFELYHAREKLNESLVPSGREPGKDIAIKGAKFFIVAQQ